MLTDPKFQVGDDGACIAPLHPDGHPLFSREGECLDESAAFCVKHRHVFEFLERFTPPRADGLSKSVLGLFEGMPGDGGPALVYQLRNGLNIGWYHQPVTSGRRLDDRCVDPLAKPGPKR